MKITNTSAFDHPRLVGVSLKMYMDHARTLQWLGEVATLARDGRADAVELFVIPDFLSLYPSAAVLEGTAVKLGAQDVFWEDNGPYTGEISAPMLAQAGCRYVEIGHAERRRLFGETDEQVAAKCAAAIRAGMIPVLCIGEPEQGEPADAVAFCAAQLQAVFDAVPSDGPLLVAYEPVWAIGAAEPAAPTYIRDVARGLRPLLSGRPARLIYGGSAGPGLFTGLDGSVDGLFLGRFAHDTSALAQVLDEVSVPALQA